jgi:hypothetical protein
MNSLHKRQETAVKPLYEKVSLLPNSSFYDAKCLSWLVVKHDGKTATLCSFDNHSLKKEVPLRDVYRLTPSEVETQFFEAINTGHYQKALALHKKDPLINVNWHKDDIPMVVALKKQPFNKASRTLNFLLELGANIDQPNFYKEQHLNGSPLWCFVQDHNLEICQLLVEKGADIHYQPVLRDSHKEEDIGGFNLLNWAMRSCSMKMFGYILSLGVKEAAPRNMKNYMDKHGFTQFEFTNNPYEASHSGKTHFINPLHACVLLSSTPVPPVFAEKIIDFWSDYGFTIDRKNMYDHDLLQMAQYLGNEDWILACSKKLSEKAVLDLQSSTPSVASHKRSMRL